MKYYYGFLNDDRIRESASGGIALALYTYILKRDGIIYGVVWDDDFCGAHYERVTNNNAYNVARLQGTKYVKADIRLQTGENVYNAVAQDLSCNREVIFIGLPCEVHALLCVLGSLGISTDNLLSVDLVCHGPTQPTVLKQYVKGLEKKYKSKVSNLSLRYKNPLWSDAFLCCDFENGKRFLRRLHQTDFGLAFTIMGYPECYKCDFRGKNHKADLTIGDYWGASNSLKEKYPKGISVIFSRTNTGEKIIKYIQGVSLVELFEIDNEEAAVKGNPFYYKQRPVDYRRDKFINIFHKYGLHMACIRVMGIKEIIRNYYPRLHRVLKNVVGLGRTEDI